MKKLMVIVLAGCLGVLSPGFSKATADNDLSDIFDRGRIPPSALNGTYSVTSHGSLFVCVSATPPFPPARCGSAGSIGVPFTVLQVGTATGANGTSCVTLTETDSDLPVDISPPFVVVVHTVARVTSYDPETATGDQSFTGYSGGQCHGASFDSTGATVVSTGTLHFAASNHGKQVDFVITSLTDAVGAIGDFSLSGTSLRH